MTKEDFFHRLLIRHPQFYENFELLNEFKNSNTNLKVFNKKSKTIHIVKPTNLVNQGLPGIKSAVDKNKFFIYKANLIYSNKYDYSKLEYKTTKNKITIICKEHGEFIKTAQIHIMGEKYRGGCNKCKSLLKYDTRRMSLDEFIKRCNKKYNNKFDYTYVKYRSLKDTIKVICPYHGILYQPARSHLKGIYGCKKCAQEAKGFAGWIKNCKKTNHCATLYIINCYNDIESFYKVGITRRTIKKRFKWVEKMPYKYKILSKITGNCNEVLKLETTMKRLIFNHLYIPKLSFGGYKTECYKI